MKYAFKGKPKHDRSPEGSIECKFAAYPNWFTSHGVYLKQKLLQAEGFPMPINWMMLTITIDQNHFRDELQAYKTVKKIIPRYMGDVAEKLTEWGYFEEARFCVNWWKFEFHQSGWPHWHIFFNQLPRVTEAQLKELTKMFPYGRVEYKKCDSRGIYAFKYAFKAPLSKYNRNDFQKAVPQWFAEYRGVVRKKVAMPDGKGGTVMEWQMVPETFSGVRFIQRSRNFQKNHSDWLVSLGKDPHDYKVIVPRKKNHKVRSILPCPVWMILEEKSRKAQLIARDAMGNYLGSSTVRLTKDFTEFESWLIQGSLTGEVINTKPHHYFVEDFPDDLIHLADKPKLILQCQKNKLSALRATRLQEKSIQRALTASAYDFRE